MWIVKIFNSVMIYLVSYANRIVELLVITKIAELSGITCYHVLVHALIFESRLVRQNRKSKPKESNRIITISVYCILIKQKDIIMPHKVT